MSGKSAIAKYPLVATSSEHALHFSVGAVGNEQPENLKNSWCLTLIKYNKFLSWPHWSLVSSPPGGLFWPSSLLISLAKEIGEHFSFPGSVLTLMPILGRIEAFKQRNPVVLDEARDLGRSQDSVGLCKLE